MAALKEKCSHHATTINHRVMAASRVRHCFRRFSLRGGVQFARNLAQCQPYNLFPDYLIRTLAVFEYSEYVLPLAARTR